MRVSTCLLALLLPAVAARADVTLASLFQEHAVLQRDRAIPVWGTADAGEHITVEFKGQHIGTTAEADGRWIVFLDPLPGTTEPGELLVTGKNSLRIGDVLVGDVWLASGQSNMEFPLLGEENAPREIPASANPLLREFTVKRAMSGHPLTTVDGSWQPASPATAGRFSAVAYYFARDLQRKSGVPVGILHASWGGTPIEAWMSAPALQTSGLSAVIDSRWLADVASYPQRQADYEARRTAWEIAEAQRKKTGQKLPLPQPPPPTGPGSPSEPGTLFNAMIAPLQPYAIRGVIWYQGEANADRAAEYTQLFPAMIRTWRAHWGQGDFPFYFVQLANFAPADPTNHTWAYLREAQTKALDLPNTGMAVTIDIGNPKDIHPRNKHEVGRRLALLARNLGTDNADNALGPTFVSFEAQDAALLVHFRHAGTGLISEKIPPQSFELAGADHVFHPATAKIVRDSVVVQSPNVSKPVAVRYAWSNAPVANLYNGIGLPAEPFRSDNW